MAIVNTIDKRVAKAALALLVASRGLDPRWAGLGVGEVAARTGLQLGDLGSLVAQAARMLAVAAVAAIDDLLE